MPFTPPTSTSITGGAIIGMAANKSKEKVPLERQSTVDGVARLSSRLTETRYQRGEGYPLVEIG